MAKKKVAASKKKVAKKIKKTMKRKVTAKKKVAKKASSKKKAVKKAQKVKKTVKKTKKAAKKVKKAAKKVKKAVKKTKKAVNKVNKTAKKATKEKTKGKTLTKKEAAKQTKPKKIKFSVNIGPKRSARKAPPGVLIEKRTELAPSDEISVEPEERKLSAKELRQIRDILVTKRDIILAEMRHQMIDSLARSSEPKADTLDRAADVLDGNVSYEVALAGHQELGEIEIALKKITDRTYGCCEACENSIGSARLKVLPSATLCAGCRKLKEQNGGSVESEVIWGFPADSEK